MAQFRTTADLVDAVLSRGGELTDGTSQYEADVLESINTVHQTIINGGNEFGIDMDESWPWAKSPEPITLELQPKYETGSVSLTLASNSGTFSAAVTNSLEGWYLRVNDHDDIFKIIKHAAGGTAFELDSDYTGSTNATANYKAVKLDYELVAQKIVVNDGNKYIDFEETAATELTSTLTTGAFTPSELAAEIKIQLDADGASVYTVTYDASAGKFTIASDLAGGGNLFTMLNLTGTNSTNGAWKILGLDIEDLATGASHVSVYRHSGITRLYESMTVYQQLTQAGSINGMPEMGFKTEYPLTQFREGTPDRYTVIKHTHDGSITVRFNRYPKDVARVDLDYIAAPIDLKDNSSSLPLLPRGFIQILINGGLFYLLTRKEDDKAQVYFGLAQAKLKAMVKQYKVQLQRTGRNFGRFIPRRGQLRGFRTNRQYMFGKDYS